MYDKIYFKYLPIYSLQWSIQVFWFTFIGVRGIKLDCLINIKYNIGRHIFFHNDICNV